MITAKHKIIFAIWYKNYPLLLKWLCQIFFHLHCTFEEGGGLYSAVVVPSTVQTQTCIHAHHTQAWKSPLFADSEWQKHPLQLSIIHINEWLKQNTILFSLYNIKKSLFANATVLTVSNILHLHRTFRGKGGGIKGAVVAPSSVSIKKCIHACNSQAWK